jgi:hypothetical protein
MNKSVVAIHRIILRRFGSTSLQSCPSAPPQKLLKTTSAPFHRQDQERKFSQQQSLSSTDHLSKYEQEYEKITSNLPRIPKQSPGRTFLDIWIAKLKLDYKKNTIPPETIHWPSLIAKCIQVDRSMDVKNFGGVLMQFCHKNDCFSVANDYMKWEKNPNLSTLSLYLYRM